MTIGEFPVTIANLTTAATPYTSADQMGNVATVTGVANVNGGLVNIVGATVTDDSGVLGAFDLVIFNGTAPPTLAADNAAAAISVADNVKVRAVFSFVAANLVNTGGRIAGNFLPVSGAQGVKCADASKDLYLGLIARSANAVFASGATSVRVALLIDRP